jgi:hypothetical protein
MSAMSIDSGGREPPPSGVRGMPVQLFLDSWLAKLRSAILKTHQRLGRRNCWIASEMLSGISLMPCYGAVGRCQTALKP